MIPKFRAWLKLQNRMVYSPELMSIEFPRCDGDVMCIKTHTTPLKPYPCKETHKECDFVLMQSTGMTDKNGVEIFEGDILTFEGFIYHAKKWKMGFTVIAKSKLGDMLLPLYNIDEAIIIGNIYQNPELIEAQSEAQNDD